MAAPRRPRGGFLLLVWCCSGVTLVTLSDRSGNSGVFAQARSYARDVANPFQSGVHSALQPVGNFLYGALNYQALEKQNQSLRQQVADDQAAAVQAMGEQAQADTGAGPGGPRLPGGHPERGGASHRIGAANFEQSIEINRGSANGVSVGQPVVSAGGLIGSVTSVSSHLATVTLLDDPSFTVGVRVVGTGVVGAAVGRRGQPAPGRGRQRRVAGGPG